MKTFKSRYIAVVAWLVCLVMLIASCSASNDGKVVALNEKAYEAHYKSLDSTRYMQRWLFRWQLLSQRNGLTP